ncbi:MAG: glycosyl hydrolase-related protein [Pirellulales bacterium]
MKRWVTVCLTAFGVLGAAFLVRAAEEGQSRPGGPLTVVTTAAHCDWAWGHSRRWHEERYARIIREVLLLMRKHPGYVWQLETENEELAPFLAKARREWPGMEAEFWQRVREGRIEVNVAISDPRISEVYPETFVRNLVLGKQYFRRHAPGIRQEVYHAVDLMCGHSQVPQLLKQADYRYFLFSRPVREKRVFWRLGLDGTRMLSVCQHYSTEGPEVGGVKLRSVSGDDRLPSAGLAEEAESWDPKTRLLSTSARYFHELESSDAAVHEMQGVLDSLEAYSEGGLHGNRNLYVGCARNEDLLLCLEKAQVMASMLGHSFPVPAMDGRWHDLLSCTGHAILFAFKEDYDERWAKVCQTRQEAERALADTLGAVTRGIRFDKAAGSPLVVFNFHPWPVTGPVEFTLDGDAVLHDASGAVVPMQTVADQEALDAGRTAFIAGDVPACGYKTFYLTRSDGEAVARPAVQATSGPVENDSYRVRLEADGRVEIVEKKTGKVLGSARHGDLGDLVFYDVPNSGSWQAVGPPGERYRWKMRADRCRLVEGPVFASVRAEGTIGPHTLTREIRLWRRCRKIEYLVEIDAQPGSGVFCIRYPHGLEGGRVFAGIPFGAEPRENLGKEPFRGEYFETGYPHGFYASRWTDVSTADRGYTFVCPAGMLTGYACNRRGEGAIEFILHRLWPMPASKDWSSNCHPSMTGAGRNRWRCALVPHEGTWREAATYRDALQQHVPLVAFSPGAGLGQGRIGTKKPAAGSRLDEQASFARIEPAGVVLSALRLVDPPGDGKKAPWELRLYETLGRQADVVVRLGAPIQSAHRTNLLGEPATEPGKIDVDGQELRFHIRPWKIVTLRVTPRCDTQGPNHETSARRILRPR